MTRFAGLTALCIASIGISSCSTNVPPNPPAPAAPASNPASSNEISAFKSKAELQKFVSSRKNIGSRLYLSESADDTVIVTATKQSINITNRQEADVDEGGIVKNYGEYLIILRRGRLFTVSVDDSSMKPIAHINAFPPGESGNGAWYDEMLISGNQVIVVGYSYARGGTEINRFRINDDGSLKYQDSYHLKSNDYYSSKNYASRLLGNKLIFYTPIPFWGDDWDKQLPSIRKWNGKKDDEFETIAEPTEVYVAKPVRDDQTAVIDTFHSVTSCDLTAAEFDCSANVVMGANARNFYVSGQAVYVWVTNSFRSKDRRRTSILYRMPLNGKAPSAVLTMGGPVDQFSFKEDRRANMLNVVVRSESDGDGMWQSEVSEGDAALFRLPLAEFGSGSGKEFPGKYRPLPLPKGDSWSFHNRFVGKNLVYAAGEFNEETSKMTVFTVPTRGGRLNRVTVPHGVDRIEVMGDDALVVGNDNDDALGFSSIWMDGGSGLGDTYKLPAATEGENRSHAFFYQPSRHGGANGLLGLPVSRELGRTVKRFLGNGSAIVFLGRRDGKFRLAGELEALAKNAKDDGCQASCVDWYGNARPIFLGNRVFALMGYELVEGRRSGSSVKEVGRVNFAPN